MSNPSVKLVPSTFKKGIQGTFHHPTPATITSHLDYFSSLPDGPLDPTFAPVSSPYGCLRGPPVRAKSDHTPFLLRSLPWLQGNKALSPSNLICQPPTFWSLLLVLEHAKHIPTSGPLHMLFALLGMALLLIVIWTAPPHVLGPNFIFSKITL